MELSHIAEFLGGSLGSQKSHWSSEGVAAIAARSLPEGFLGINAVIQTVMRSRLVPTDFCRI
jgi:hypothetical protein